MAQGHQLPEGFSSRLIFLQPQVLRPMKANFSGKFRLLSDDWSGYIFTLCNERHRNFSIGKFNLYSETRGKNRFRFFGDSVKRLFIQAIVPIVLLRKDGPIAAIVASDPYASGFAGLVLKHVLKTKLIVEVNGDYHTTEPAQGLVKRRLMKRILKMTLLGCDGINGLNKAQQEVY